MKRLALLAVAALAPLAGASASTHQTTAAAKHPWTAWGVVRSVHDGDTLRADLDLGWSITIAREPIRLAGINAPELGQPGGHASLAALMRLLPVGAETRVRCSKREKYGRSLCRVYTAGGVDVNKWLVDHGFAVVYP